MKVEVVQLPRLLKPAQLAGRSVVVFDVLRATTTMTAALAAGVSELRIFGSTADAEQAACGFSGPKLLCGESKCLPPPGFDLGNSPGVFAPQHKGLTMFMSTTNGTRAIVAAQSAAAVFAGCLLNADAVATVLRQAGQDVTLLCAGTDGEPAGEDQLGAGVVIDRLLARGSCDLIGPDAFAAHQLYETYRDDPKSLLSRTPGGKNVLAVGLGTDIDFAARFDVLSNVGRVLLSPLRVVSA